MQSNGGAQHSTEPLPASTSSRQRVFAHLLFHFNVDWSWRGFHPRLSKSLLHAWFRNSMKEGRGTEIYFGSDNNMSRMRINPSKRLTAR